MDTKRCIMYWRSSETSRHLFHNSSVTIMVWENLLKRAGYGRSVRNRWEDEVKWVEQNSVRKDIAAVGLNLLFTGLFMRYGR